MTDYRISVHTCVDLTVDVDGLKEEFPDIWEEVQTDGLNVEEFLETLVDYEGVDYLINSEFCLDHEEFSPEIVVFED